MILVSNGVRTYVFENETLNLNSIKDSYKGLGYCFEIATYPSQDQTSMTSINNVAAPARAKNGKASTCVINFNASTYTWAIVVDEDSELYTKIMQHYITPKTVAAEEKDENAVDAKKIAAIREALAGLTKAEVAALTQKETK